MEGKYVFAAGQLPFETNGLHFCTLVPLCGLDGDLVDAKRDFPNSGLCWFMLRDVRFQALSPGQLVLGPIEQSRDWNTGTPEKHWWQLQADAAQPAGVPDTLLEVLETAVEGTDGPRALIAPQHEMILDHRPSELVLVRLGNRLYGPFRTRAHASEDGAQNWRVKLERTARPTVWQAEQAIIDRVGGLVKPPEIQVSMENTPLDRAGRVRSLSYAFLPWHRFERLKQAGAVEIELLSDAEVLSRAARDHLKPKAKRQQLMQLLRELEANLQDVPEAPASVALATAKRLASHLARSEKLGEDLLESIVASGELDERIERHREKRFEEYVAARAAEVEARISDQVKKAQKRQEQLNAEAEQLATKLDAERTRRLGEVEDEIRRRHLKSDSELQSERKRLDDQREALRREQQTLAETVTQAAARFDKGRAELLSDLLVLLPALQATGVMQPAQPAHAGPQAPEKVIATSRVPAPFVANRGEKGERLDEKTFFERFARHVDASAFRYREADLRAFHLSLKCGDLTVLAGLSGIGKSSLMRLYAEALAGEDQIGRTRLLTIDVSPAWTEPQDILGTVNLLDRRFEPAASGLFNHLFSAALEYAEAGPLSGMVVVGLDEMNLAQVEHYFAGFIQALERPHPRDVAVFDPSALTDDDPLRKFARLPLPPNLRFVGTVNFDETTRPLSQRLKDRAAILELEGERYAGLQAPIIRGAVTVEGPQVLLADVQGWLGSEAPVPIELATLMDEMTPRLVRLGAPITGRRAKAIRRLFAASGPMISAAQVLDIAIATRVLPLIRGLSRPNSREEASRVLDLLASAPGGCPDSSRRLTKMLEEEQGAWTEVLED